MGECWTFRCSSDLRIPWFYFSFLMIFLVRTFNHASNLTTLWSFLHAKFSLNFTWLLHVRCSRKRFTERQAEQWWAENRARVYERYNVRVMDKSSIGIGSEETHWFVQTAAETKSFCIWKTKGLFNFQALYLTSGVILTVKI